MIHVHTGQCGLCSHFGEHHRQEPKLVQIRLSNQAPEDLVEECGLPENRHVHLMVTPVSGCDGFEPAPDANLGVNLSN